MSFFYKPMGAWAADFIPFHTGGQFRLFYLHDWRNPGDYGEGTPWYQISTNDFVHFTEHGMMLRRGMQSEQDLYVFTGSVIEAQGHFHIFYTGHNPYFRNQNKPEQGIMHAMSDDLLTWRKVSADTFYAPEDRFELHDWRDPFVFWNQATGEYWMLLAARLKTGPSRRRGCTALCTSKDLKTWHTHDPLYAPGLYYTHECPDLFQLGDWWYLLFSEFSEKTVTRYRMARKPEGLWLTPDNDQFDGRAFYAAKTASDGHRRYLFGWNATRENECDTGTWQWGGNLVVHEILQQPDGCLTVNVPASIDEAFTEPIPLTLEQNTEKDHRLGVVGLSISAAGTFVSTVSGPMSERCKIETILSPSEGTRALGLMLHPSDDLNSAYYIRWEPTHNRIVFDMWPRRGDLPYLPELERPILVPWGQSLRLKVFVDGTVCEIYANNTHAMSTRMYDLKSGNWGVFVQNGSARFEEMTCHSMPQ